MTSRRYRAADYRTLEGTLFTLSTLGAPQPGGSIVLRLDAVRDLGERQFEGGALPCCALLFSQCDGPGNAYAPQGTYRLAHPELGDQELFVVPMGPAPGTRMRYEVIFN